MIKKSFTLIEMLVVIGIIGILAGLLFPAISRARDSAKGVTCLNNFKQISVALANYQADNDGFLPYNQDQTYPNDLRNKTANLWNKMEANIDYNYIHSYEVKNVDGLTVTFGDKGGDVWRCPKTYPVAQEPNRKITGTNRLGFVADPSGGGFQTKKSKFHAYHSFFGSIWGTNVRPENGFGVAGRNQRIRMSAPPNCLPLLVELCRAAMVRSGQVSAFSDVPLPHNGGMTVGWLDGHVSTETPPAGKGLTPCPDGENDKFCDITDKWE